MKTLLVAGLLAGWCFFASGEEPQQPSDPIVEQHQKSLKALEKERALQGDVDDDPLSPTWRQPRHPQNLSPNHVLEYHQKMLAELPRCTHGQFQPEPILKGLIMTDLERYHEEALKRLMKERQQDEQQKAKKGKAGGKKNQHRNRY